MSPFTARIRYFVRDALDELRHSPGPNLLAFSTLFAALFVAGLLLLLLSNVADNLERLREAPQVEVYLADGLDEVERIRLETRILAEAGVRETTYVSPEEALERFRATFGDELAALSDELPANPLPASFEIRLEEGLDSGESARRLAEALAAAEGVVDVRFDRSWLERVDALVGMARVGGTVLGAVVLLAVAIVMGSVLRLAVYARRTEIEIMSLVGATPGLIRGPFLVAGLAHGLSAALLALVAVELLRRLVLGQTLASPTALVQLVVGRPLGASDWMLLILVGVVVAVGGSWAAVRSRR